MKKIVILYSTGGMGHKKAALAIADSFARGEGEVEIETIDVLDYGNKMYHFLYKDFYVYMMTRGRGLWGLLYDFSNIPFVDHMTRKGRGKLDYKSLDGLGRDLRRKSPDAIIATHFLLPSIAYILKKDLKLKAKLYTVITDYGPHSYWLSDHIDKFFVGSDPVALEMDNRNVPLDKIEVSGIPTGSEFSADFDRDHLLKLYNVDGSKKTVFMMSGGFGVGPMEKMLLSLNDCEADIQVITVCGHNKQVCDNIDRLRKKLDYPVILFGFTDKVAELMAVSDIMITKAGGISTTEALNSHLPMVLFGSVPGQETWNEKMLLEAGAAFKAKKVHQIPALVDKLLKSENVRNDLRSAIEGLRKPYAADTIRDAVLKEIGA